eukprot:scaffold93930_cov65-Phaeocystis_antarctica.AAC.2
MTAIIQVAMPLSSSASASPEPGSLGDGGGGSEGVGGGGLGAGTVTVTCTFFATETVGADSTVTPSSAVRVAVVAEARPSAFVCTAAPTLLSSSR